MKIIIVIFLFLSSSAFGQYVIRGKVVDEETKLPISKVKIYGTDQYFQIEETDSYGFFTIPVKDSLLNSITFKEERYEYKTLISFPRNFLVVELKKYKLEIPFGLTGKIIDPYLSKNLDDIEVIGYANNRPLNEIPAAISKLQEVDLQRFANNSLVPAVNTVPGVRMEERSPGSYRLAIRGSALRSPFGIRNVKLYWNDIPFTDANGNSYLNLLDFSNLASLEIIKGPAGSLYGAGTGGVILMNSPRVGFKTNQLTINSLTGSYGLFGTNVSWQQSSDKINSTLSFSHQESNGYREQTRMRRDVLNWQSRFFVSERRTLNVNLLYSDLYYQTPGGLTRTQMEQNPRQARPSGGGFIGSVAQQAAIFNKTFLLGFSQEYDFNERWTNKTSFYGAFTNFENPAIRNYERRSEQHLGGRTLNTYEIGKNSKIKGKIVFGGEFQKGFNTVKNHGNRLGLTDTLQTDDEIPVWNYLFFAQTEWDLPEGFYLTVGGSYNRSQINFQRLYKPASASQERNFNPVFVPRIALLKKWSDDSQRTISVFGSISSGFSPPTVAEVLSSNSVFNPDLKPEKGISYETGFRGLLNTRGGQFKFDVTSYLFRLNETIVIRRAADGSDFYQNAGKTNQKGIETALSYDFSVFSGKLSMKMWTNFTYNDYRFDNYKVRDSDFSGNWLTGVPHSVSVSGVDAEIRFGFYTNLTFNYTDRIWLNDANSESAAGYKLLGGRLGWKKTIFKKMDANLWVGIDNAFDEKYSLGNDLNAAGNRFFNPAAGRNYYAGVSLKYKLN